MSSIDIREMADAIADVLATRAAFDAAFDKCDAYNASYFLQWERREVDRAEERLAAVFSRAVLHVVAHMTDADREQARLEAHP